MVAAYPTPRHWTYVHPCLMGSLAGTELPGSAGANGKRTLAMRPGFSSGEGGGYDEWPMVGIRSLDRLQIGISCFTSKDPQ